MYGTPPETSDHITLPLIYPPFAAIVLLPLPSLPWCWPGWCARAVDGGDWADALRGALRLWPSGGRGGALSVASIAPPLALAAEPGKADHFSQPAPPIPAFALQP